MLTAIDLNETKEFSVKGDSGELKTIFVIKVLKNSEKLDLFDGFNPEKTSKHQLIAQLKVGLKEIRNVTIKGEPGPIKITDINDDVFDMFSMDDITEIIEAITIFNSPSEQEIKN